MIYTHHGVLLIITIFSTAIMLSFIGIEDVSTEATQKECEVYGRIKIVETGEDYRVRIVSAGEDLRVKYVQYSANTPGLWRKVNSGEDYRIKIVSSGEHFSVREVNSGFGCNL